MKALILAAGFGTRLEESYRNYRGEYKQQLEEWVAGKPKGLVIIRGKPVVQYQLEQLLQAGLTRDDIFVHTNALYYSQYLAWGTSNGISSAHIFNNGVLDNEHRLGAVGDLRSAICNIQKDQEKSNAGFIVLASDTLLFSGAELFNFCHLIDEYQTDGKARVVVYEGAPQKLSRHGIVEIDHQGIIIGFEEKPFVPKSNLVNASVHIYSKPMVDAILVSSLSPLSESGQIIATLYSSFPIKTELATLRLDIGTVDDVLHANLQGEFP